MDTIEKHRLTWHMEKVVALVREKCSVDTSGGRFQHLSLNECLVFDVAEFTEEMHSELKAACPRLLIDIFSDHSSLSGFVIRLRLQKSHHQRVLVTAAALACMAAIVAHSIAV